MVPFINWFGNAEVDFFHRYFFIVIITHFVCHDLIIQTNKSHKCPLFAHGDLLKLPKTFGLKASVTLLIFFMTVAFYMFFNMLKPLLIYAQVRVVICVSQCHTYTCIIYCVYDLVVLMRAFLI